MNDNDMLIRQVLGRYRDNNLRIRTVLTHRNAQTDDANHKLILRDMAYRVGEALVNNAEMFRFTKLPVDPEVYGVPWEGECYTFSREQLMLLIKDVFDAGYEAKESRDVR